MFKKIGPLFDNIGKMKGTTGTLTGITFAVIGAAGLNNGLMMLLAGKDAFMAYITAIVSKVPIWASLMPKTYPEGYFYVQIAASLTLGIVLFFGGLILAYESIKKMK
jgi:hypothetical protein